jgi:uncharacterized protein (DUF1330 family)
MAAYLIVNIDVHDPVKYEEYKRLVAPTLAAYGARYLARGGAAETLEGDWQVKRVVVLEFESVERAKAWWSSIEYSEAKALRQKITDTQMIVVEGL